MSAHFPILQLALVLIVIIAILALGNGIFAIVWIRAMKRAESRFRTRLEDYQNDPACPLTLGEAEMFARLGSPSAHICMRILDSEGMRIPDSTKLHQWICDAVDQKLGRLETAVAVAKKQAALVGVASSIAGLIVATALLSQGSMNKAAFFSSISLALTPNLIGMLIVSSQFLLNDIIIVPAKSAFERSAVEAEALFSHFATTAMAETALAMVVDSGVVNQAGKSVEEAV